jgi:hypothetical protein
MPDVSQQIPETQPSPQPIQEAPIKPPTEPPIVQPTVSPPPPSTSPKRTIFIALAVGVLIMAIAAIVYVWLTRPKPEPAPAKVELPKAMLVLTAPKDQEATTSAQITVQGKTNPNSLVTAYTDTQEETFESNENGDFSGTLSLDEGPNEIIFTAYGQDAEEKSETRSVVYITEKEL